MKTFWQILQCLVGPCLFAIYEITKNEGFFQLGAFIIIASSILVTLSVVIMLICLRRGIDAFELEKLPMLSKPVICLSLILSLAVTLYLAFFNHWIIAAFCVLS